MNFENLHQSFCAIVLQVDRPCLLLEASRNVVSSPSLASSRLEPILEEGNPSRTSNVPISALGETDTRACRAVLTRFPPSLLRCVIAYLVLFPFGLVYKACPPSPRADDVPPAGKPHNRPLPC